MVPRYLDAVPCTFVWGGIFVCIPPRKEYKDERTGENLRPFVRGGQALQKMGGCRLFPRGARPGQKALYHCDAAAQYHGAAAHGPRHGRDLAGYPHPLQAHAGLCRSVGAGHGPCVHCHRGEDRGEDEGRGPHEAGPRPRQVFGARLGLEKAVRRAHRGAAEKAGLFLRLAA